MLLFLEGVITFISPCLLPMIPIYVSYFAGSYDAGLGHEQNKAGVLINAAGFVLGFTIVFVLLGAFAGTIGRLLREYRTAVNIATGLVVVVFGLNYLGAFNISLLNRQSAKPRAKVKELKFTSSVLFGIVFSIGWTPCIGVFLGSALMLASRQGSVLTGMLMLFVFSMGLGISFIASAVLIDRLKAAFDFVKRNYRVINALSGSFLVVVGILMMTGAFGYFLSMFDRGLI
jgi:cytochrome c-type biogenesis protein